MGVIYIGSELKEAPRPEKLRVSLTDAGSTGRTAGGRAVRYLPRSPIRSIRIGWRDLPYDEAAGLIAEISCDSFMMKYPDPLEGGFRTAEFFCSARDAEIAWAQEGEPHIKELSCTFTEV